MSADDKKRAYRRICFSHPRWSRRTSHIRSFAGQLQASKPHSSMGKRPSRCNRLLQPRRSGQRARRVKAGGDRPTTPGPSPPAPILTRRRQGATRIAARSAEKTATRSGKNDSCLAMLAAACAAKQRCHSGRARRLRSDCRQNRRQASPHRSLFK